MSERFYKLPRSLAAERGMPPAAKILYAVLADRIGGNTDCWPGIRTIADDSGLCIDSVVRNLKWLEQAGIVAIDRGGRGRSNRYRLTGQSAPKTRTLQKPKRSENQNSGVLKTRAQALRKPERNQTDPLNQTFPPLFDGEEGDGEKPKTFPRKPDPVWDAICAAFALNPVTKTEKSRIGKIVRDLKLKEATPDLIARQVQTYRARWPKVDCTPEALLKHWDSLLANPGAAGGGATDGGELLARQMAALPVRLPGRQQEVNA